MSARERFLTFLLCVVKIEDDDVGFEGRGRGWAVLDLDLVVDMREDKVLVKAREVVEEMGLCLVLEGSLVP